MVDAWHCDKLCLPGKSSATFVNFASDLGAACDSLAEEVFESEFVVQSAALRKISGQAV